MSRIGPCFSKWREASHKALIPFVTAGDPNPDVTVPLMHAMVTAGADLLELGVPFSDPMADGPVIQRASERALQHAVSLHQVLDMVREFRLDDAHTPVVLMGYLNPVEVMGYEAFAKAAADAGVDGVLTVDMPPEEASEFAAALGRAGLDPIFLLAPTSNEERIRHITSTASGFVYYVSLKGVTGAAHLDTDAVAQRLGEIRALTELPLGVGFGISNGQIAAAMSKIADAVVVGSALVKRVEANQNDQDALIASVSELIGEMRTAIDA